MQLCRLILEMAVVGAVLVIVSLVIAKLEGTDLKAKFIGPMVWGVFLTGALTHLLFEIAGANEWYAKQYTPIFK